MVQRKNCGLGGREFDKRTFSKAYKEFPSTSFHEFTVDVWYTDTNVIQFVRYCCIWKFENGLMKCYSILFFFFFKWLRSLENLLKSTQYCNLWEVSKLSLGLGSFLVEAKIEADILMISDIFLPFYFTAKQRIKVLTSKMTIFWTWNCLSDYCWSPYLTNILFSSWMWGQRKRYSYPQRSSCILKRSLGK